LDQREVEVGIENREADGEKVKRGGIGKWNQFLKKRSLRKRKNRKSGNYEKTRKKLSTGRERCLWGGLFA